MNYAILLIKETLLLHNPCLINCFLEEPSEFLAEDEGSGDNEKDEANEVLYNESDELNQSESTSDVDILSTALEANNNDETDGKTLLALCGYGINSGIWYSKSICIVRFYLCNYLSNN